MARLQIPQIFIPRLGTVCRTPRCTVVSRKRLQPKNLGPTTDSTTPDEIMCAIPQFRIWRPNSRIALMRLLSFYLRSDVGLSLKTDVLVGWCWLGIEAREHYPGGLLRQHLTKLNRCMPCSRIVFRGKQMEGLWRIFLLWFIDCVRHSLIASTAHLQNSLAILYMWSVRISETWGRIAAISWVNFVDAGRLLPNTRIVYVMMYTHNSYLWTQLSDDEQIEWYSSSRALGQGREKGRLSYSVFREGRWMGHSRTLSTYRDITSPSQQKLHKYIFGFQRLARASCVSRWLSLAQFHDSISGDTSVYCVHCARSQVAIFVSTCYIM